MSEEKSALVLGATGMIGKSLAASLIEGGWRVHAAARFRGEANLAACVPQGCRPVRYDVTQDDPHTLPDVEVVFLEIWDPSDPGAIWPINFYGVGRVVERYTGVAHIVNGSTINVYGNRAEQPDESTIPQPSNEYGLSRYSQEKLIDFFCVSGGRGGIHVRYAHANTATRGVIHWMAERIVRGESLGNDPDRLIQVIALEDFVRVTRAAVDYLENPPTTVNCCHPRIWKFRELAQAIQTRLGKGTVVFDRQRGGIENSAYASADRMVAWFGEPQVPLDVMLDRVADNFI